ncbi:MAG: hypothetical protein D4R64_13975 [Porphyromonadaceae bacterium]|nr:MAG: hypothetical protein D4R64_13975 [Porphyromonadaceae bacterium]
MGIKPDFTAGGFDNSDQHIDFIHRRTQEEDIYFVSNSALNWQKFTARFRIPSGKTPYLWMADDGSIRPCKLLESGNEFTTLEMNLPPAGSAFVVFLPRGKVIKTVLGKGIIKLAENKDSDVVLPDKPWKITFPGGRGAPKELMMNDLSDWTLSIIDGVKYFSGTARYSTTFNISVSLGNNQNDLILDLGDVKEIAVVKINGVTVDTLWKQPYVTSVSKFVRPGKNQIEIDVTNLWHNRLVGDAGKVGPERITRTNVQNRYRKNIPLLPSGLIGPVVIRSLNILKN